MGDITDLFSINSRTRVSPQKSYVASYTLTGVATDTGATLSVANGQYYAFVCNANGSGGGTITMTLLENGVVKQTITASNANSVVTSIASQIFKASGAFTVKVQATNGGVGSGTLSNIQLISGTSLIAITGSGNTILPINAYITNLEMVGASMYVSLVTVLNLSQDPTISTTNLFTGLNLYVSGINCSAGNTAASTTSFAAFDFDGKTLAL